MEIIITNRDANIKSGTCYKIRNTGTICSISKEDIIIISSPFEHLKIEGNSISSINDLNKASIIIKERDLAKKRVLIIKEKGGYVLVGSLTCMGTILIGTIIFMAIKFILMK